MQGLGERLMKVSIAYIKGKAGSISYSEGAAFVFLKNTGFTTTNIREHLDEQSGPFSFYKMLTLILTSSAIIT